eukprot:m.954068 g.954068  ORF g.954068 m.954068 type:complete len:138 (-) comp23871_c1_seq29:70-483(-)
MLVSAWPCGVPPQQAQPRVVRHRTLVLGAVRRIDCLLRHSNPCRMTSASKMTSTPAGVSTSSASSVDDYYHHHPQRGGAIANPKVAAQSFVNAVTTYAVNRSDLRHEFESVLEEALAKYISETLCGAQSGARTAEDK